MEISANNIKTIYSSCDDFVLREIRVGLKSAIAVSVCWLDGVVSSTDASRDVIRPLTDCARMETVDSSRKAVRLIEQGGVYRNAVQVRDALDDVVADVNAGHAALIFEALHTAVTFEVKADIGRQVTQAQIEKSVKGAKDAFVETLRVNTGLVRKRLQTADLKMKQLTVGRQSHTQVTLLYIEGIAQPARVAAVLARLEQMDVEAVLGVGDIEPYLTDTMRTPFPLLGHTERPDKFAAALLNGRVGVLADGLPVGFLVPGTFSLLMQAPEDGAEQPILGTCLTLIRYLALFLAVTLPAGYVAAAMHHREMIPTRLLESLIRAESDVPFSVPVVMIGLLLSFELLQEAGFRLPEAIGQTVSIIGALLIGEAAVAAKLASPIAIIVVAMAGIAGYNVPNRELAGVLRVLRLALVPIGAATGLVGLTAALAMVVWHLCTLESGGVAYLHPFVDGDGGLRETIIMPAQQKRKLRDGKLVWWNRRRQK